MATCSDCPHLTIDRADNPPTVTCAMRGFSSAFSDTVDGRQLYRATLTVATMVKAFRVANVCPEYPKGQEEEE